MSKRRKQSGSIRGQGSKPPNKPRALSTKPQNVYKRDVNAEKRKSFTESDEEARELGEALQDASRLRESAHVKHIERKIEEKGVEEAVKESESSMSRFGTGLKIPAFHGEVAKRSQKSKISVALGKREPKEKGKRRGRRNNRRTHVSVPREKDDVGAKTVVSLRNKGGRSTAYPAMVPKGYHPLKGEDPTHDVLATWEGQRKEGEDIGDVVVKGTLLRKEKMTMEEAISPSGFGSFELPGAQGDEKSIKRLKSRNTGKSVKRFREASPERGGRLFESLREMVRSKKEGVPGYHQLKDIDEQIGGMEKEVFDSPRTPPGSPLRRDAYREQYDRSPSPSPEMQRKRANAVVRPQRQPSDPQLKRQRSDSSSSEEGSSAPPPTTLRLKNPRPQKRRPPPKDPGKKR